MAGYIKTPVSDKRESDIAEQRRRADLEWQARSARAADNRDRIAKGLKPRTGPIKI